MSEYEDFYKAICERGLNKESPLEVMTVHNVTRTPVYNLCGNYEFQILRELITDYLDLQAENVALKERLEKAVELPVPLGALAICIRKISIWDGVPPKKRFKWVLTEERFTIDDIPNFGKLWFPNTEEGRKQAEARLKELKGEEK